MKWFSVARSAVLVTLVTGIYLHLSRLVFGIDLTLERLVTPAFDSVLAVVILLATLAVFLARKEVLIRSRWDSLLVYFTLVYFAISVPVHVRTWFVPDNPQLLRVFPPWYSVLFLFMTGMMIVGWLRLEPKPAAHPALA